MKALTEQEAFELGKQMTEFALQKYTERMLAEPAITAAQREFINSCYEEAIADIEAMELPPEHPTPVVGTAGKSKGKG
jgi:hypothetical protein